MNQPNYTEIGQQLEKTSDQDELVRFRDKFRRSTDGAMASLATYATFRLSALCLIGAGRLDEAKLAEMNAWTIHQRDVKPENQWGARRPW